MMKIVLLVAASENGVIGKDGALPWRLPGDLKRFKGLTLGKCVVMGRKTFESIGKPLPKRFNIVVTRNSDFEAEGAAVAGSLEEALTLARDLAKMSQTEEIFVIGGGDIYRQALDVADRIELTRVAGNVEGDAFFPEIDPADWRECRREAAIDPDADRTYEFLTFERRLTAR